MQSIDTNLLRTFVTVAELKSFTKAAKVLNLTQSAVSLQVRRLEETVDATLLHRNTRGVKLSTAGGTFLSYAQRILKLEEEAMSRVRQVPSDIRIGFPDVYAVRYMPAVLEALSNEHPEAVPEVYCDVSTRLIERFEAGELDVALAVRHDPGSSALVLGHEALEWVAAPALTLGPADVVPLAVYPEYCVFRRRALKALAEMGRAWRIAYTTQSSAAIDTAIHVGYAVAVKGGTTVQDGWVCLGEVEGLPSLGTVELELHRAARSRRSLAGPVADLLERVVREDMAARAA